MAQAASGAGSGGLAAERERSGGPGFHGPGCPDGSAKPERQAERRGRGRRLTRAAREPMAGRPAKARRARDPSFGEGRADRSGGGERREEPQSREAGASAKALDKAAASRMREVTWDTLFSSPLPRPFRNPRLRHYSRIRAHSPSFPHNRACSPAMPATAPVPAHPRLFPRHARESGKPSETDSAAVFTLSYSPDISRKSRRFRYLPL